jgi:predicted GNAT superfamily acetyltransferase
MSELDARIRRLADLDDIQACMNLQRDVWGFTEPEDMAPPPLLILGNRFGGCVLLAESVDGHVIGFSYAFLCQEAEGSLFWWSHMTAVSPDYRGKTVGFQLKLAQRQAALDAGIDRIRWTFDPLQALNAYFNIRKLGVRVLAYESDIYGPSSSPLHHGMPTDRLLVEWNLNSASVSDRLGRNPPVILRDFDGLVRILASDGAHAAPPDLTLEATPLVLEIPTDINAVRHATPDSAREWQKTLETACLHYLARGYAVTDFLKIEQPRPQTLYVLENQSG